MNSFELYGVTDRISPDSQFQSAFKNAYEAFNEAMSIYNDPNYESKSGWKKEAENEGATVHSKYFDYGKVFALRGELPISWDEMYREEWEDVDHIPEWNNNIAFAKIVHQITPNVDVVNVRLTPLRLLP
uniref:START domain-containing protein n=1 Tax=Acrobeloides nanus TaxID=290746 RepID=A0A914DWC3_9BILA